MTKIHLVYPHGNRISCPDAIGRHLGEYLKGNYDIQYHDWDKPKIIKPGSNDILLSHADPSPFTCFRMSLRQPGWKRIILMTPYSHGNTSYNAFINSFIDSCDEYLAITGNYWFSSIDSSLFSHWYPRMVHLDLAVDSTDFPFIKDRFAPPGKRRFVFIGKSGSTKNTCYLEKIAQSYTKGSIGWVGTGRRIKHLDPHGYQDFSTSNGKSIIRQYDFLLTVSQSDANPATILESMAWGLIPICTPQSGYINYPGIINVPLGNPTAVIETLNILQNLQEDRLREMQRDNTCLLKSHFNWKRFSNQVIDAIENQGRKPLHPISPLVKSWIIWRTFLAPYATWHRPKHLMRVLLWKLDKFLKQ